MQQFFGGPGAGGCCRGLGSGHRRREGPVHHRVHRGAERLLQGLELRDTVFRSDHASNYLVLKGVLGADKPRLLAQVREAIERPQQAKLRQEWQRGL